MADAASTSGRPISAPPPPRLASSPARAASSNLMSMSSMSSMSGGAGSAIQVVVRLRPMNESEKKHGTLPVVNAKTAEKSVTIIKGKGRKQHKSNYKFDNVFTAFSSQEEVFEATVKPVIVDVMRGFEATVFAYGQTGTGKTHTMEGSLDKPELYGVIPRSAQAIFEHLKQPRYREEKVTCSCLEIYNEELRDLLLDSSNSVSGTPSSGSYSGQQQNPAKLDIMEGKSGPFCRGLTKIQVHSASDVLNLMQKAQHSRMIGETNMNKSSSRSHCLFTIQVHGKLSLSHGDGEMEFNGKLHMVDLAGSECAKSAGNDKHAPDMAARERERLNINRSLLTLGRVITVLKEKSSGKNGNARIPYRDSKLTRVLQEALGGRCKTVIVATISPSITAIEESVSTLNYAHSANGIVNKPVSSSMIALGDSMPTMMNLDADSKSPRAASVASWQEMEMRLGYMQTQVDEAQAALARKHLQHQELQERAEKAEVELLECQQTLCDANKEIKTLTGVVESETNRRKEAESELHDTRIKLKKTEMVLSATQMTESSLTVEAQTLIGKLEEMIRDRDNMHDLVVSQRDAESEKRNATKQFQQAALVVLNNIESSFTNLRNGIELSHSNTIDLATLNHEVGRHSVSETQKLVSDIAKNVSCITGSIRAQLVGEEGLIPTVETGSNSVLSAMQSANDEFVKGEESFEQSREAMRNRLDDCTKTLDERASSIQSSTSQALKSFESKMNESKKSISHLVMNMKNSLTNLSKAKAEKAKALDGIVEQWRDQSLANSKNALDATTTSCASLKSSIGKFQKELHSHEEMKQSLESQREFLDGTGCAHVQSIGEHGSLLNAHCQKLAEVRDTQSRLRNEVMQSILSGVESLVSKEMNKLASTHNNDFQVLDRDGANLAITNEQISKSGKAVMENVQTTNRIVSDKAHMLNQNDLSAREVMKSTQNTLQGVITSSNAQHELTANFASESLSAVSDMKKLDGQNSDVVKIAERDGKACSVSLMSAVFKPTSTVMKKTLQSSLDTMAYVKSDVVLKVNADLGDIANSRRTLASQMNDKFGTANSKLTDMKGRVTSIAQTQHEIAQSLGNETLAASNTHLNESVPHYYAELDSGKEKLVNTMDALAETSARTISKGKDQGSVVRQSMEIFAQDKMQCSKPVESAPLRKECHFSHHLSSTATEDDLFKGTDFTPSSQSRASLESSSSADAERSMKTESPVQPDEVNTSRESHDDTDAASRKSCGSFSSLPSPRLKFRDINANREDNNNNIPSGLKSRKPHQRHALKSTASSSASRKSRHPSGGKGTPSSKQPRKKMKR